jgi:hypothetical protein
MSQSQPLYPHRFISVLKFSDIGLAAVQDNTGAYHIDTQGLAIYTQRYDKCYNFYHRLAAVALHNKFFHINTHGFPAYQENFTWVGNFQENYCVVNKKGNFYHINHYGQPMYPQRYDYVGDFKEGIAVVYQDGVATHIDQQGQYLHNQWFKQLDIYHKGFARAEDDKGWFHIDKQGHAIYPSRYKDVEPFYNDLAKVQTYDGALLQINSANKIINFITPARSNTLTRQLSDDLVGFWKTFVMYTGVKLDIFAHLPAKAEELAHKIALPEDNLIRILRALWEIDLLDKREEVYFLTKKGQVLQEDNQFLATAAILWANVAAQNWLSLPDKLATPLVTHPSFKDEASEEQYAYLHALAGYAVQDVGEFFINSSVLKQRLIGFGRSSLGLIKYLVSITPTLKATIFAGAPLPLHYLEGTSIELIEDLDWADKVYDIGIVLRFLHYFNDDVVLTYLKKMAQLPIKKLLIFETLLSQESPLGGLLDMNMLMETGGKLRTLQQWQHLFEQSHYTLISVEDIHPCLSQLVVVL